MKAILPILFLNLFLYTSSLAQYTGGAPFAPERGGIIINEVSQGPTGGFSEYIEYIVVGAPADPTAPVDITGWITDDNNFPASGEGNAAGHISFGDCYNAIPPGSIIVVYNNESPNPLLPTADPQDANGDGVYIIPHNDSCMDACPSNPTSSNGQFCPCTNPSSNPLGWEHGLRNGGDVVQVRDACETVVHVIHWGNVALTSDISSSPVDVEINGSQSGRVIVMTNETDNNWNNLTNYENPMTPDGESPGEPNSSFNANLISAIANGTFQYNGVISDCRDTDAGDLLVPVDATSDSPISLCEGDDLAAFTANYDQPDEFEPDAVGFLFEYAFILALQDGTIIDFNTTGNFDFSNVAVGNYIIYGFSYIQTNGSVSITQFLDAVSTIQDILDFTTCGYNGDLTNLDPNGITMEVNITSSTQIFPVNQPIELCSDNENNILTVDLTTQEQVLTNGEGGQINWYQDPNGNISIDNPNSFETGTTAVYASSGAGDCESDLVEILIIVHPFFSIDFNQSSPVDCEGNSTASVEVLFDNGNPVNSTYDWNIDEFDGSPNLIDVPAGTYSVTVIDENACARTNSIIITEPEELTISCAELTPVSTFGGNDGVAEITHLGGTPIYNFVWQPAISGFDMANTEGSFQIPNLVAGDYAVTVIDANACEATCSFTITAPDCSFELNSTSENMSCFGEQDGQISLEIIGGILPIDILWSTGENSLVLQDLSMGNYSVTITDGEGCSVEQSFDIIEPGELVADVVPLEPTCFNTADGQITINSIEGGTAPYLIYNNNVFLSETDGMTYIIGNLPSGDYQLSIEDQNGCSTDQNLTIAEVPILSLTLGADKNVGLGQNIQLDPILNFTPNAFEWMPPLYLNDPTLIRPVATPEEDITYVFFAAFSPDCFVMDSINIRVDKTKKVYIPNAFSPNDDGFNDRFTVYSDISIRRINKMQIFDRWGEMVFEKEDFLPNAESEGWNGKYRGKILHSGLYVYVVEFEFVDGKTQVFSGDLLLLK